MNRIQVGLKKDPLCGACGSHLPVHGALVEASDKSLQDLIKKSPLPVVVDVWAPWCAPCRAFSPVFEEFSGQYAGKLVFAKLNSDSNPQAAGQFGIRGIPTILVFKNGSEVIRQSGAIPREQFGPWLDQYVK
jgi:thioredoxin 2